MIDWWNVLTNSLWIAGSAMVLATLSYADWRASTQGEGLRRVIRRTVCSSGFHVGTILICVGAGLGVSGWTERLLWFLPAAGSGARMGWTWLTRRKGLSGERFE